MNGAADAESPLIYAVRAGDTASVKRLLREDSGPTVGAAAFCLAVRARFAAIAQLLLQYGVDPRQCAPGSLLPLREAVDSGSPALVQALLDDRIRGRYAKSELLGMRDLARHWRDTGVVAELRQRTGSEDVVTRTRVQDDEFNSVDEFTLDGMTVRDGHGAILTHLEELLGVRTSFEELMDRALAHADQNHTAWASATMLLAHRRDRETWTAAAALRTHTDPVHRLFGAEVLRLTHLFDDSDEDAFAIPALDTLPTGLPRRRTPPSSPRCWSLSENTPTPEWKWPSCPTPATMTPESGGRWRAGSVPGPRHLPSPMPFARRCES
nr:ankyrin repeat domain-containing protein [Streptomyces sp. SLBN-118]